MMKKIVFLCDYPPMPGGIAGYAHTLVKKTSDFFDVSVITFKDVEKKGFVDNFLFDKRKLRKYLKSRILTEFIAIPYWVYAGMKIVFKVLKNKQEIVHLQYEMGTFHILVLPFLLLFKIFGVKTIITHHEHYGNFLDNLNNIFIRHFDLVIVHTNHHKNELLKAGFKDSRIKVLPFGIRKFRVIPSRKNHKTALVMGYFLPRKGYLHAINAFSYVVKKIPDAKLLFAGTPAPSKEGQDYYNKMVEAVKKHNLSKNVRFLGYVPEKDFPRLFSKIDIVLLPYLSITQSSALFDTLGYYKPIIASNIPGFSEFMENSVNGYLVNPKDIPAFGKKIVLLLNSSEKMKIIQENNKRLAKKDSWDNVIKDYRNIYNQIE